MSITKKHQCPSCGGCLSVDNEKQIYRCASCGSTYDFDYFREEKLLELGDTYLARGEFKAAVDVFKLILQNDPHDFQANRGMMLAAARMNSIDEIISNEKPEEFSYNSQMVSEAVESSSEEDKGYFTEFEKLYSEKRNLADRLNEIQSLKDEEQRLEASIRLTDDSRYDYYITTKYEKLKSPKSMFIMNWCSVAFFVSFAIFFVLPVIVLGKDDIWVAYLSLICVAIAAAITINNLVSVYPRVKKINDIDKHIEELKTELIRLGEKIETCEAEAEKFSVTLINSCRDFVEKDRRIAKEPVHEYGSGMSTIRKHQCPSCGGGLIIDNDKQMYHCTFCGSTYDYEYFREDRIHEAGETYLSRGEFMATTEAYEFMLKKDPHDFLALRGLMLAAAHLTDMSELDQVNKEFDYDSKIVSQVIENASEEDKKYFNEFAKVYAEKKRVFDCSEEIETLLEEKNKINSVITQNNKVGLGEDRSYDEPVIAFIAMWVGAAFFMIMTFVFVKDLINAYASNSGLADFFLPLVIFFGAISLILIVVNILSYNSSMRKIRKMKKANAELYDEVNKIDDKISDLERESSKLTGDIRRFIHDFVRKDRLIMRDNKSK